MKFGFSPCPNDTFAFHALVHGLVPSPITISPVMDDIESLNQRAMSGELELTKLSFGALAQLSDTYVPLTSGAALGHGVGPLIVGQVGTDADIFLTGRVASPGQLTTAQLLFDLYYSDQADRMSPNIVEMRYDRILEAVQSGAVDGGLIIHESRFTYQDHGLEKLVDLGEWWFAKTGLPVPLAAICARVDVPDTLRMQISGALRRSVEYAFSNPEASSEYVSQHAQEMSQSVCRQHIDLYVNEHTIELDDRGLAAINQLIGK